MTATYYYGFPESVLKVILHEPSPPGVPEALIHDVWQHQRFQATHLETVGGIPITVIDPGVANLDAGPDFLNAKLRLGSTTWTGAVEIHTSSGIWQDHAHDRDPRYNSTLLHVVLYHDIWTGKLRRCDGTLLPELVLYPHLEASLRRLIHSFYTRSEGKIMCASGWGRVPDDVRGPFLQELALERIITKARRFGAGATDENALYEGLFAGLGYSKNTMPMRTLARTVPLDFARRVDDAQDTEALYFGASGLLPDPGDLLDADRRTADYVMDLRDRFDRLNHKLGIAPMPPTAWRFFRLRPANFPTLRIAQAAAMLRRPDGVLRKDPYNRLRHAAASKHPIRSLRELFAVELNPFWTDHVRLGKRTRKRKPSIGRSRIDALIVNVVIPALLAGRGDSDGAVLELLRRLPASHDEVTRHFEALGTQPRSAADTQALHQLYRTRCTEVRCLTCAIGEAVLSEKSGERGPPSG